MNCCSGRNARLGQRGEAVKRTENKKTDQRDYERTDHLLRVGWRGEVSNTMYRVIFVCCRLA